MPDIVSGILTGTCILFGGYLFARCICSRTIKTTNDYYIITKDQLEEIKTKIKDTQPLISVPPPEYSAPAPLLYESSAPPSHVPPSHVPASHVPPSHVPEANLMTKLI